MDLHKLLKRQLKKLGLVENALPITIDDWRKFIDYVNKAYYQADQDRYLQDQSMLIVTDEMNELNDKLTILQKVGHLGYWYSNLATGVTTWSKELYTMFGLQVGMPVPTLEKIYEMIHVNDIDFFKKLRDKSISNSTPFEMEIRLKKLDSTNAYNWYYLIGYPQNSSIHHIIMDINRHKLNEEKIATLQKSILESEKMAILGQLSGGIAHEINNPLCYTLSNMGVLEKRLDLILKILDANQDLMREAQKLNLSELKEYYNKVLRLTNKKNIPQLITDLKDITTESTHGLVRIRDIVRKIRSFSDTEKPQMSLININDCIQSALDIVIKNSSKYQVQKDLSDLPAIWGSFPQLVTVFVNLLFNAKEAILDRGTIRITSKTNNSKIVVSIADTGIGIAPENASKIFTPFFTTKLTGSSTGLGLAAVYGIIKLHNGTVSFESTNERGSIFTIELPVSQKTDEQTNEGGNGDG